MQSHIFFCCRLRLHFVYFEFILFVDIDGVSCTLKCHLFCSSQERARRVSRKQVNSKWTLQFENVSKNHKQFSNIFTKCLQASCMTSSDNLQPTKSGWYTFHGQLPTIIMQWFIDEVIGCNIWSIHSVADSDSVQTISIEGILMSISHLFRFR